MTHTVTDDDTAKALGSGDVPVLGTVKITSALFFDIGVYLTVIGVALMVFESFGDDAPLTSAAAR